MGATKHLTVKQAAFRDFILAGFNPSEAYKKAFDASKMSKKCISVKAAELLRHKKIKVAITVATQAMTPPPESLPAPSPSVLVGRQRRLEELSYAALLDPAEMFDDLNHFKPIKELPEHVRRAIAGFEVDPVSFITKVKFVDKRGAIMDYSKLAGDIPAPLKGNSGSAEPTQRRFDLSKLTEEEFKTYLALKRKTAIASST